MRGTLLLSLVLWAGSTKSLSDALVVGSAGGRAGGRFPFASTQPKALRHHPQHRRRNNPVGGFRDAARREQDVIAMTKLEGEESLPTERRGPRRLLSSLKQGAGSLVSQLASRKPSTFIPRLISKQRNDEEDDSKEDPAELAAQQAYREALRASDDTLRRAVALEKELMEERKKGQSLAKAAESASRRAKELELAAQTAQKALQQSSSLSTRLQDLQHKLTRTEDDKRKLEGQLSSRLKDFQQTIAKTEEDKSKLEGRLSSRVQELEKMLARKGEESAMKVSRAVAAKTVELEGALTEAAEARHIANQLESEVQSQKQEAALLLARLSEARQSEEARRVELKSALDELESTKRVLENSPPADMRLKQEIADLENLMQKNLISNQRKLDEAEAQIAALRERADIVSDYEEVMAEKEQLQARVQEALEESQAREAALKKMEQERDVAVSSARDATTELERIRIELSAAAPWAEKGPGLEESLAEMTAQVEASRAQSEALDRRMAELTKLEEELKESNFSMERDLEAATWDQKALKRQNKALQDLSERNRLRYTSSIAALNEQVTSLEDKLEGYVALEEELVTERALRAETEKRLTAAVEARTKLVSELDSVRGALASEMEMRKRSASALNSLGGVSAIDKVEQLQSTLKSEKRERQDALGEISRLQDEIRKVEGKVEEAKAAEMAAVTRAASASKKVEAMEEELAQEKDDRVRSDAELAELKQQVESLNADVKAEAEAGRGRVEAAQLEAEAAMKAAEAKVEQRIKKMELESEAAMKAAELKAANRIKEMELESMTAMSTAATAAQVKLDALEAALKVERQGKQKENTREASGSDLPYAAPNERKEKPQPQRPEPAKEIGTQYSDDDLPYAPPR
jgi:hypothetical protein